MAEGRENPRRPMDQSAETRSRPPRRRGRRWWLWGLGGVLLVLVLLLVLLPTLLSTGPGNRMLLGWIDSSIAGSLEAEHVEFGWFEGPTITNAQLYYPPGELVADMPRLAAPGAQPFSLMFGGAQYGDVYVDVNEMHVRQQPGQPTNVQLALSSPDRLAQAEPEPEPDEPDEPMEVDEDLSGTMHITAGRITYEGPDIEPVEMSDVRAVLDVTDVQNIELDLNSDLRHGQTPGRIAARATLRDMFSEDGVLQWREGAIIDGRADLENVPVAALDRLMQQEGQLAALLGSELDAEAQAEGEMDALTANIIASSEHMNLDAQIVNEPQGLRSPGGTFTLNVTPASFAQIMQADATVRAPGAPDTSEAAGPAGEPAPQLLQPVTFQVTLNSLTIPRRNNELLLEQAAVDARATADNIRLDVPQRGEIGLQNSQFNVTTQALGQQIDATFSALASHGNVQEPVEASLIVTGALGEAQARQATLDARSLPMPLVDALAGLDGRLATTVGDTLSTHVEVTQPDAQALAFNAQVDAPRLTGALQGQWNTESRQGEISTPAPMQMTLTPQAWGVWLGEAGARLALVEPTSMQFDIDALRVGLRDPAQVDAQAGLLAQVDPQRTSLGATFTLPRMTVQDPQTQQRLAVTDGQVVIPPGQDLTEVVEVLLNLTVQDMAEATGAADAADAPGAADAAGQPRAVVQQGDTSGQPSQSSPPTGEAGSGQALEIPGTIQSRTRLSKLVSPNGILRPRAAHIISETIVNQVPSVFIDAIAQQSGQLAAILGPFISAEALLDYQIQQGGEASATLNSSNVTGELSATIDEQAIMRLREDATLNVQVTPAVGQALLRSINPLLGSAVGAQAPINLHLQQQGFAVPLDDFDWSEVTMRGGLDQVDVTLMPAGFMHELFSVLRLAGVRELSPQEVASVSPLAFTIARGQLTYDQPLRITLSDDMAFVFTGGLSLVTRELNMTLGFSGTRFAEYRLTDLALPISGTINEPAFDEERLAEAVAGSVGRGLLREGLDEIFGRDRTQQDQQQDEDGQPEDEQQQDGQDQRPRSPLDELRDLFE